MSGATSRYKEILSELVLARARKVKANAELSKKLCRWEGGDSIENK